jgi:TM2 domain-containing membrane protein YozV
MKAVGIIVNIFLPGIGTLLVGKVGTGIAQILLFILAMALNFTVLFSIIGIPLALGIWVWGIVSAATARVIPDQY